MQLGNTIELIDGSGSGCFMSFQGWNRSHLTGHASYTASYMYDMFLKKWSLASIIRVYVAT